MKHLKTYNESISSCNEARAGQSQHYELLPENIIQELKDICLELTDVGYNCRIENRRYESKGIFQPYTYIMISEPWASSLILDISLGKSYGKSNIIDRSEVNEVVERIKDYTSQCGYEMKLSGGFSCVINFTKK